MQDAQFFTYSKCLLTSLGGGDHVVLEIGSELVLNTQLGAVREGDNKSTHDSVGGTGSHFRRFLAEIECPSL